MKFYLPLGFQEVPPGRDVRQVEPPSEYEFLLSGAGGSTFAGSLLSQRNCMKSVNSMGSLPRYTSLNTSMFWSWSA